MSPVNLRKLLTRDKETAATLQAVLESLDSPVWIEDAAGQSIAGQQTDGATLTRLPLISEEQTVGYVVSASPRQAASVAALASYAINHETAEKNLGREVLDKYRELNLLYELSEKLSLSLELTAVATVATSEAQRLIKKGSGALLLRDEQTDSLAPTAEGGLVGSVSMGVGIMGSVARNDHAEIVNDVAGDPRRSEADGVFRSLICAPLKARQRVIGLIVFGSAEPVEYTAADLKFLAAIASQAAPALENALHYEKTVREAREREAILQRQLADLQIQIDKSRQAKQVEEITGTDYFKSLREQAKGLREGFDSAG